MNDSVMDAPLPSTDHASLEQLSTYLDRRLDEPQASHVAGHLETCRRCATELAELEAVRALVRALPQVPVPRPFLLPEPARVVRFPRLLLWTRALSAVAAAFFVMFLTIDVLSSTTGAPGQARFAAAPTSGPASVMALPTSVMSAAHQESAPDRVRGVAAPRPEGTVASLTKSPMEPVAGLARQEWLSPIRLATVVSGLVMVGLIVAALMLGRRTVVKPLDASIDQSQRG